MRFSTLMGSVRLLAFAAVFTGAADTAFAQTVIVRNVPAGEAI